MMMMMMMSRDSWHMRVCVGFLVDYISHPVINSFTTAAAITIAASQLKASSTYTIHMVTKLSPFCGYNMT